MESCMFRLASLFALACLTLAATTLLKAPKAAALEPRQENDDNPPSNHRSAVCVTVSAVPFHARFSLN
jgi:hypothetical protein